MIPPDSLELDEDVDELDDEDPLWDDNLTSTLISSFPDLESLEEDDEEDEDLAFSIANTISRSSNELIKDILLFLELELEEILLLVLSSNRSTKISPGLTGLHFVDSELLELLVPLGVFSTMSMLILIPEECDLDSLEELEEELDDFLLPSDLRDKLSSMTPRLFDLDDDLDFLLEEELDELDELGFVTTGLDFFPIPSFIILPIVLNPNFFFFFFSNLMDIDFDDTFDVDDDDEEDDEELLEELLLEELLTELCVRDLCNTISTSIFGLLSELLDEGPVDFLECLESLELPDL